MSKYKELKTAFEKLVPLENDEWKAIESCVHVRNYKKGEYVCRESEVEKYLSITASGSCRGYYTHDGREVSVAFMFDGDYVSAYYSFLTQRPSALAIQALSNVKMYSISKTDLDRLCDTYKKAERIGRLNAERIYRRKEEREISLLTKSATERYINLITRHPQVLQEIPLKYIASYLGIKPESLSRIRKQITQD